MVRAVALVASVVLAVAPCPPAWAGGPTEALRQMFTAVNRILDDPELRKTPAELRAALRNVLLPSFDSRETARLVLDDEWPARTPPERDEFAALLVDRFERTYVFRIATHAPMDRGLAIRYVDESTVGRTATVSTAMVNREGGEIPVEYRLIQRDGRWAIFDVVIDDGSLVDNYRTLFSRVIAQSSYPDVVALMKSQASGARLPAAPGGKTAAPAPVTPLATAVAPSPAPVAREQTPDVGAAGPSPEPAATALRAPKPPAPTTAYWLQVGAFKNPDAAGGLAARLRTQNLPVSIDAVTVPPGPRGTPLSRVRVGPFTDQAAAAATLRDLQTNGYRPFLAVETR